AGFQAMFVGRDPMTGELLGRPHGRNAVPAFDVVLRPTKSVSFLYGLGDPSTAAGEQETHPSALAIGLVGDIDDEVGDVVAGVGQDQHPERPAGGAGARGGGGGRATCAGTPP